MGSNLTFLRKHIYPLFPALTMRAKVLKAKREARSPEREYAEGGLDSWLIEQLGNCSIGDSVYVEVGGNHPINMSNTYRLYRRGMRGYVVEPNADLIRLHRLVRPGDCSIQCACGSQAGVLEFIHLPNHENSYIGKDKGPLPSEATVEAIPLLTVDQILSGDHRPVFLLSIDTEGHDFEVLGGAQETLTRTTIVCVELVSANDATSSDELAKLLGDKFTQVGNFGNNTVFRRD